MNELTDLRVDWVSLVDSAAVRDPQNKSEPRRFLLFKRAAPHSTKGTTPMPATGAVDLSKIDTSDIRALEAARQAMAKAGTLHYAEDGTPLEGDVEETRLTPAERAAVDQALAALRGCDGAGVGGVRERLVGLANTGEGRFVGDAEASDVSKDATGRVLSHSAVDLRTDEDEGDPDPDEDRIEKAMLRLHDARATLRKSDDATPADFAAIDDAERQLGEEYMRKHSGYWANDQLVAQRSRLVKQEGRLGSVPVR